MKYNLIFFMLIILSSCGKCEDDELWREKFSLSDGSYVFIYHSWDCQKKRPIFTLTEKIIRFVQLKNDVFDMCISDEQADLLSHISYYNIREKEDYLIYCEDENDLKYRSQYMSMVDTTYRPYECYYSMKDSKLIPLMSPFRTY